MFRVQLRHAGIGWATPDARSGRGKGCCQDGKTSAPRLVLVGWAFAFANSMRDMAVVLHRF